MHAKHPIRKTPLNLNYMDYMEYLWSSAWYSQKKREVNKNIETHSCSSVGCRRGLQTAHHLKTLWGFDRVKTVRSQQQEAGNAPTYPSNPGAVPGEGPPLWEAEEEEEVERKESRRKRTATVIVTAKTVWKRRNRRGREEKQRREKLLGEDGIS